jgi:hypothetical protein
MKTDHSLVPVEQKSVSFYNDEIVAIRVANGAIYVPIRPICDNLGVTLAGQRERINRDPVLAGESTSVSVTLTQQAREMICLPLKYIPGWLFGINADRVKPELRDKVIRYQRECYDVLAEAFSEGRLTADPAFDDLLQADTPAAQAYRMARALMEMARQQLILEARLGDHAAQLAAHDDRLEQIEATLGDRGRFITPEQASSISQAVKAIAMALGKKSGRNEYGAVYGEFYRKFGIPSYRELPARRFDEAARFLADWYQMLTGEGLPF